MRFLPYQVRLTLPSDVRTCRFTEWFILATAGAQWLDASRLPSVANLFRGHCPEHSVAASLVQSAASLTIVTYLPLTCPEIRASKGDRLQWLMLRGQQQPIPQQARPRAQRPLRRHPRQLWKVIAF